MINFTRIKGLFMRHFYLIRSSVPRIIDLFIGHNPNNIVGIYIKFFSLNATTLNYGVGVILSAAIYDFI